MGDLRSTFWCYARWDHQASRVLDSLPWVSCKFIGCFLFGNSPAPLKGKQALSQARPSLPPQSQHPLLSPWTQTAPAPRCRLLKSQSSWMQVATLPGFGPFLKGCGLGWIFACYSLF